MRWKSALIVGIVTLLVSAGGCSSQPSAVEPSEEVSLIPVTFHEWQSKLAGYKGEIVVVDFWATWCAPCLERFPKMVELHRKYRGQGVTFVSVSLDDRDDPCAVEDAHEFLKNQNATLHNYLMNEIVDDAFDKLDLIAIPAVFVYNQAGELSYRLTADDPSKPFTEADVEKAIQELLKN